MLYSFLSNYPPRFSVTCSPLTFCTFLVLPKSFVASYSTNRRRLHGKLPVKTFRDYQSAHIGSRSLHMPLFVLALTAMFVVYSTLVTRLTVFPEMRYSQGAKSGVGAAPTLVRKVCQDQVRDRSAFLVYLDVFNLLIQPKALVVGVLERRRRVHSRSTPS